VINAITLSVLLHYRW